MRRLREEVEGEGTCHGAAAAIGAEEKGRADRVGCAGDEVHDGAEDRAAAASMAGRAAGGGDQLSIEADGEVVVACVFDEDGFHVALREVHPSARRSDGGVSLGKECVWLANFLMQ